MASSTNPPGSTLRAIHRIHPWSDDELRDEIKDVEERCFLPLAEQFTAGSITLSEYMDGALSHLKQNGAKHKWDVPTLKIGTYMELDIFVGAVKSRSLDPTFALLTEEEFSTLKELAIISWTTDDPSEFDRRSKELQLDLSTVSPEMADLLLVACYCRRHVTLFKHLIRLFPQPPEKSTFDIMETNTLRSRTEYYGSHYQHSPKHHTNVGDEISLWTELLNSAWLHKPAGKPVEEYLCHEVRGWDGPQYDASVALGTPKLSAFFAACVGWGWYFGVGQVGAFLGTCSSVEQAREYLEAFPVEDRSRALSRSESGALVGNIVSAKGLDEGARVEVLEMVMERFEAVDVDCPFDSNPWEADMPGCTPTPKRNALQIAASAGEKELAGFLVRRGARVGDREFLTGLDAAGFARKEGKMEMAEWLEGLVR